MKFFKIIFLTVFINSCGGGSTPSPGSNTVVATPAISYSISKYAGHYQNTCDYLPGATAIDSRAALYEKTSFSVANSSAASASITYRIDFFENSNCSGNAIGYLENNKSTNTVTVVGQRIIDGKQLDDVVFHFSSADESISPSMYQSSVIIGDDFKLSIPGVLFAAVDFPDLWLLEGQNLFQSNDSLDSSGKLNGIDTLRPGTKISVPTRLPFASCRSTNVPWPNSSLDITQGGFCNALSPKARHGESVYLFASSPDSGSGKFICNNGSWESDGPASQYQSCSKPIVFSTCPKKDVTWTSGYNGLTCSGTLEQGLAVVGNYTVGSSDPINSGVGYFYCGRDINGGMSWTYNDMFSSCIARPPAPAPITDPKLLAQSKNCLTCHGDSTPYSPYIGPSFKQISDYYKLNPQSTATIEYRIKFGNTGNFGTLPMPANPQVSGDDLAIIIPWILAK